MRIVLFSVLLGVVCGCGGAAGEAGPATNGSDPESAPVATPAPEGDPDPEASATATPRRSKVELARLVFEAVQAQDFERFSAYLLRLEDVRRMAPVADDAEAATLHGQIMETNRMYFAEAYAAGEHRGVVWASAVFRGAEQNGSETRPNIFILFESGGEPYSMKMDDCIETERGWVLGDYLDAPQHGESNREPIAE